MSSFKAAFTEYLKKIDIVMLLLALVTSGYGLLLISSAARSSGNTRLVIVQSAAIFLGIIAYFFITLFDIEVLSQLWKWALFLNLGLLILPLFFGTGMSTTGNNSWIRFDLFGTETGFQPAEFGKLIFIFTLARHIRILGEDLNKFKGLIPFVLHGALVTVFVYAFSKDDGMALSYIFIFFIMAFAAGLYLRYCLLGLAVGGASVPILWNFVMAQYQKDRFIVLFDAAYKLDGVGYHQFQSKRAIASGGFWGDGLYQGSITQYGHLPAKQTDFIFTVACEELGFFGGLFIVLLISAIIAKCVVAAISMREDRFSMLVCVGIAAMLAFQTFINIGMNLGIAPVVGLTLPFVSYGGTSVLTMFMAIGIVSSLKSHYIKRSFTRNIYG